MSDINRLRFAALSLTFMIAVASLLLVGKADKDFPLVLLIVMIPIFAAALVLALAARRSGEGS